MRSVIKTACLILAAWMLLLCTSCVTVKTVPEGTSSAPSATPTPTPATPTPQTQTPSTPTPVTPTPPEPVSQTITATITSTRNDYVVTETGEGEVKIYSITRILEQGSDV